MKSKISALMDGELEAGELNEPLAAVAGDAEARETWRTYHLIGDVLQGNAILGAGCVQRVAVRLQQEPTLVATLPRTVTPGARARWFVPSALAAGVAAVALVGWLAFAPQQGAGPSPAPVAQAPQAQVAQVPARVPLASDAQDYLLAHQAYSPRNSLFGMAPYVRSVSDQGAPRKP
jgi:sigma-E factor negative regulatory protein RseA